MSSGSSLSSFVGVTLAPLFLARGQPDKLGAENPDCDPGRRLLAPPAAHPGAPDSPRPRDPRRARQTREPAPAAGNADVRSAALGLPRAATPAPGHGSSPPVRRVVPRDVAGAVTAGRGAPVGTAELGPARRALGPRRGAHPPRRCTAAAPAWQSPASTTRFQEGPGAGPEGSRTHWALTETVPVPWKANLTPRTCSSSLMSRGEGTSPGGLAPA